MPNKHMSTKVDHCRQWWTFLGVLPIFGVVVGILGSFWGGIDDYWVVLIWKSMCFCTTNVKNQKVLKFKEEHWWNKIQDPDMKVISYMDVLPQHSDVRWSEICHQIKSCRAEWVRWPHTPVLMGELNFLFERAIYFLVSGHFLQIATLQMRKWLCSRLLV